MSDVLTPEQRSYCMSRNRGSNTKPEVRLRRELWRAGRRYRIFSALPGKPDIVFPSAQVAVFVDGCFWHGCPDHFQRPKTNSGFWADKIAGNQMRDANVELELARLGWRVLRVWEHEIKQNVTKCARKVQEWLDVPGQET